MLKIHSSENNRDSQLNLFENHARFTKQCEKVLSLLKEGKRLTVKDALITYDIGHLPRRIADLKENGINVKSEWIGKVKAYYL